MQNEKVIEVKTCKHCNCSFEITDKDLEFYEKISPSFPLSQPFHPREKGVKDLGNGKFKYLIPSPTLCPDCRMQRRMSWRNERNIYKRICDASGRSIISIYSPNKKYKIYEQEIWHSGKWNAMDYGKDFDFNKNFFKQFEELMLEVPFSSMYAYFGENSEYCNCVNYQKNCYLTFASSRNENVLYASYTNDSVNCLDTFMTFDSENCYQTTDCKKCYKVYFSQNCVNCSDCIYSKDLVECKNCFGCSNLVGKKYFIENKEYSKEEYFKELEIIFKNYSPKKSDFHKYMTGTGNENVSGDYIRNSKNTFNSFDVNNLENCKFLAWFHDSKNCYDAYSWGQQSEMCYEGVSIGENCSFLSFCSNVDLNSSFILYSIHCANSSNCFGCVGLKNKSYCILNKQYTKEEYDELVPKIIEHMTKTGEWGEFFPSSISPFGYNETVANEYFPINKEEIENSPYSAIVSFSPSSEGDLRGLFNWSDYEPPFPKVDKIIQANKLPESISGIPDDILNWAIECEITKKPFRIIKQELEFYRKHNLPIPRRHPDQRHLDRMALRNPRKLFDRKCDKCKIDMKTTYSPDRKEIVYCEECYKKEVY